MGAKSTSAMHVIKKEDKYEILRDFIAQDLDARRKAPLKDGHTTNYYLIARSPESHVARAVADLADEAERLGISIFTVFALTGKQLAAPARKAQEGTNVPPARVITDCRLLDAHEALLLGEEAAWVGDCMRRDPALNDAYERFSNNCVFTSQSVKSAFDHLWTNARLVKSNWLPHARNSQHVNASEDELIASSALPVPTDLVIPTPTTRH